MSEEFHKKNSRSFVVVSIIFYMRLASLRYTHKHTGSCLLLFIHNWFKFYTIVKTTSYNQFEIYTAFAMWYNWQKELIFSFSIFLFVYLFVFENKLTYSSNWLLAFTSNSIISFSVYGCVWVFQRLLGQALFDHPFIYCYGGSKKRYCCVVFLSLIVYS